MKNEVLIALIASTVKKMVDEQKESFAPVRGPRGVRGPAGADFVFEDHQESIQKIITDYILQNVNQFIPELTDGQLEHLKGKDGKDFILDDHKDFIVDQLHSVFKERQESLKLRFEDLTEDEKLSLKGADGRDGLDGKDGRDFSFEESRDEIEASIQHLLDGIKDSLKLKFQDLSDEERQLLRGPRGQRGKAGADFVYEEHQDKIENVVVDSVEKLFNDNKDDLKLKFEDLSEEEKEILKLKFYHLTEEERNSLRGPRGQRGKQGARGADAPVWVVSDSGKPSNPEFGQPFLDTNSGDVCIFDGEWRLVGNIKGPRGIRGAVGPQGLSGVQGPKGDDGKDGEDGSSIVNVELEQVGNSPEYFFKITLSDGEVLETNSFKLPRPININQQIITNHPTSSSSNTVEVLEEDVSLGDASQLNFDGGDFNLTFSGGKATINLGDTVARASSAGYSWGRSGVTNALTWLLTQTGTPSNKTGLPFGLVNGLATEITVASSSASTFDVGVYIHDGNEINLTLLHTVNVVNDLLVTFPVAFAVLQNKQLAVRIESGSTQDVSVFMNIRGEVP